jgi:LL-diaminopimelate aminotransferase
LINQGQQRGQLMKKAKRLLDLPPYPFARWAAEVSRVRLGGMDVIRLDIGNPDLAPHEEVVQTLYASAGEAGHHGYSDYRGLPSLRRAIAAYYTRRFGVSLDPEKEVVPLIGSKEGIVNLALACLDPGDLVLVPDPGYAPYTMGAMLVGAEVVTLPLLAANDFLPDLDAVPESLASRAAMMWLNYPNNPTGAVADLGFLSEAVAFARRHSILLCYDAPYCDVTFNGYVAPSILQVEGASEVVVEFNSLSKTYNMAGWRMGMAVGNAEVLAALSQVKSNVDSGMFHPLQDAAIRALSVDDAWIAARNEIYRERLQILVDGLELLGLPATLPRGGLYLWVAVPRGETAEAYARRWLEEAGVAVAPGSFFGPVGSGYIRIAATAPTARIREAMERVLKLEAR